MKRWRNNNRQSLLEGYDIPEIVNCNPLSSITLKSCGLDPEHNFLKGIKKQHLDIFGNMQVKRKDD